MSCAYPVINLKMAGKQKPGGSTLQAGYDCTFVTPLMKDLQSECSVCLHVLREPHIVGCCGYRFCGSCIEPIQKNPKRCPLCNNAFNTLPDRQLERILNEKTVYCSHKHDGCEWTGRLVDLEGHLFEAFSPGKKTKQNGCLYEQTKCFYCEKLFFRKEIKEHARRCPSKQIPCTHCKVFKDTALILESVHYGVCHMFPVLCPNDCGAKPFRKNLEKHIDENCPKAITQCSFRYAGCNAEMSRKEMAEHCNADNIPMHMALTVARIVDLEEENSRLKVLVTMLEDSECRVSGLELTPTSLEVGNLPPCTNEQMMKSIFGQNGPVECVTFKGYGEHRTAEIEFVCKGDAIKAISRSVERGINLKSQRLIVKAVFN